MKLKSNCKAVSPERIKKVVEAERQKWMVVAIENGWFSFPFFVEVWIDEQGLLSGSRSYRGIEKDVIHLERRIYKIWGLEDVEAV